MFTPKTVFIVGAGASREIGLPVGDGLRDRIVEMTYYDRKEGFRNESFRTGVHQLCNGNQSHWNSMYPVVDRLRQGLPNVGSIDSFLDINRGNEDMISAGKMAIVISILEAERNCALDVKFGIQTYEADDMFFRQRNTDPYDASWYVHFGRLLTQRVALDNVESIFDNVSFITFNYDRCIETFAFEWLKQTYGLDERRAAAIAGKLEVLHVYGSVGSLPWKGGAVPFGYKHVLDFHSLSQNIKTFTESADSDVVDLIRSRIEHADTIAFLGFGWLPQNLDILALSNASSASRVFFTTYGVSETDRETVRDDLGHLLGKPVVSARDSHVCRGFEERGTCADLFKNNWRQLTRN